MTAFRYRCFRGNHQLRAVLDGGEFGEWHLMENHLVWVESFQRYVKARRPIPSIREWFVTRDLTVENCWHVDMPSTQNDLIDWIVTVRLPTKQLAMEFKLLFG